jgi:hypothetical protein
MQDEELKAVWIAHTTMLSIQNLVEDIERMSGLCREDVDRTVAENNEFKFARACGRLEGTIIGIQCDVDAIKEILKNGLSATSYLSGDMK